MSQFGHSKYIVRSCGYYYVVARGRSLPIYRYDVRCLLCGFFGRLICRLVLRDAWLLVKVVFAADQGLLSIRVFHEVKAVSGVRSRHRARFCRAEVTVKSGSFVGYLVVHCLAERLRIAATLSLLWADLLRVGVLWYHVRRVLRQSPGGTD